MSYQQNRNNRKSGIAAEKRGRNHKVQHENNLELKPVSNFDGENTIYCVVIALVVIISLNFWGFYLNPRSYHSGLSAPIPCPTCPITLNVSECQSAHSLYAKFGRDTAFEFLNPYHYMLCAALTLGLLAISYTIYLRLC